MNRKAKGSRNERKSKCLLEGWGYKVCKSGGSLGEFDLIGIKKDAVILIQSKSNRRPDDEELREILKFEAPPVAKKYVHVWFDRKKNPAVINETDIRRILDGESVEIKPVHSVEDNQQWNDNHCKTSNRDKQSANKRLHKGTRPSPNAKPRRGSTTTKVRRKRKARSVAR